MTTAIEIEIDGKTHAVEAGQMIIEVADRVGVYIPRFCYHKHLSIAANCRMCLVEVEKSPKALPACATPVMAGMKVWTQSVKTVAAQRAVMEFLLINHPLDCPICDQGGECELQDLVMGYGSSHSDYHAAKRAVLDEDLGPLIATEMTRCILCTRCVRFGSEIAGVRELGVVNRGEHAEIATYVKQVVQSPVSGNIIDLCPVGALTSKPFRFKARAWELAQAPSIAPHDCLGSNINVHTLYGKALRVVARENQRINTTWISDRDRFSYTSLDHTDRITAPRVRVNGVWETVSWEKALLAASVGLRAVIDAHGADQFGALAHPSSTLEELYLFQRIARGVGSPHVDYRLREMDVRDQAEMSCYLGFSTSLQELEQAEAILLIGTDLTREQPLLSVRLRQAVHNHCAICVINPVDFNFNFDVAEKAIAAPHHLLDVLSELAEALTLGRDHLIANRLRRLSRVSIILGALAMHHPHAADIRDVVKKIALATDGRVNFITDGANTAGGFIAGALPYRDASGFTDCVGLNAYEMLKHPRKAYLLLNVEPEDCANAFQAVEALKHATCVVALSTYEHPLLLEHAHVILPVAPFTESSGTFVNAFGEWQSFAGVAKAFESARPAWKTLRVLGQFLQLDQFLYDSSEAICAEIKAIIPSQCHARLSEHERSHNHLHAQKRHLSRVGEIPCYSIDGLLRRAAPLQKMQQVIAGRATWAARIHPATAERLGLAQGDVINAKQGVAHLKLPIEIDARIAIDAIWIPGGVRATNELGDLMGAIEV